MFSHYDQGSKVREQTPLNWCTTYIPNDDTQNYAFCRLKLIRLDTQLNEPNNQNSRKVSNVVESTNNKKLYYFGD